MGLGRELVKIGEFLRAKILIHLGASPPVKTEVRFRS